MQDASKVAATLGVTFAVGVLTGWLLNSYTRKVRERKELLSLLLSPPKKQESPNQSIAAPHTKQGLEGMLNKLQSKVKRI